MFGKITAAKVASRSSNPRIGWALVLPTARSWQPPIVHACVQHDGSFIQTAPKPVAAIVKRSIMKQVKLKSLKRVVLAGLVAAAFLPALAGATSTAFNVEGQWDRGFVAGGGTFSGMMSVDTIAGEILSMEILFADFPTLPAFNTILSQQASSGQWLVGLGNGRLDPFGSPERVSFSIIPSPGVGSLVGFESGVIRQGGSGILDTGTTIKILQNFKGNITPAVASVPEPATLGMFGLGTLLIGGFVTLRRRMG
jgi:hypothetical protein